MEKFTLKESEDDERAVGLKKRLFSGTFASADQHLHPNDEEDSRVWEGKELKSAVFCFFVNEGSGGNNGKLLLEMGVEEAKMKEGIVRIYNLKDPEARRAGMEAVAFDSKGECRVYVIACGGDGSVIWVIDELIRYKPDYNKIVLGVVPLGTGNDFSIATGFWSNLIL